MGRPSGETLIEVLVALVVTSAGLLGMAGLMSASAAANQAALQRTQASLAAQALIESMHVNAAAVAQGMYALDAGRESVSAGANCLDRSCDAVARANHDLAQFDQAIAAALPSAQSTLKCARSGGHDLCRLEVIWNARPSHGRDDPRQGKAPQTLAWVFQP